MTRFSDRVGATAPPMLQLESMTHELKTAIWNVLDRTVLGTQSGDRYHSIARNVFFYLNLPVDDVFDNYHSHKKIKSWYFDDGLPWYEPLNFLEHCVKNPEGFCIQYDSSELLIDSNYVLEQHNSGYRFIAGELAPITDKIEIESLTQAIQHPLTGVREHMAGALRCLSQKPTPDLRNTIKEAISAVESLCKVLAGNPHATLTDAAKVLKSSLPIHGAMLKGLENLYHYTSDGDGIRHGLMEEPNLNYEDAVFMLIMCSAFVNYLTQKASKLGVIR